MVNGSPMKTRSSSTRTGARGAIRFLVALLSLFSLLSFVAPLGSSARVVVTEAACDASERPTLHDRQIEPLRVPMVRPSRRALEAAPGFGDASFATLALSGAAPSLRPARVAIVDPSIPAARARAERMVFLI